VLQDGRELNVVCCVPLRSRRITTGGVQSSSMVSRMLSTRDYELTRSSSTTSDKKSTIRGANSSSYDRAVSAKVYRIAETTVALTEGAGSRNRA
jgi:hypothetical protein